MQGQTLAEPREVEGATLFAVALVLSASQLAIQVVGMHLLFVNGSSILLGSSSFLFMAFAFQELLPFLASPVLLFCIFYRLGKRVSLVERYRRVVVLLFAGGMIGGEAVFWFAPLGLGETPGAALPDLLSIVVAAGSFA